jgi:hypothetical protein
MFPPLAACSPDILGLFCLCVVQGLLYSKSKLINFDIMEKFRKLTPHDLAFGIGRKATKEELEELFNRPLGKLSTATELLGELKERNEKKKIKKAS